MLSELRNYQTKSVTLNLGHPVVSTDTLIMKGKGKGIDSCYSARLYLRIHCSNSNHHHHSNSSSNRSNNSYMLAIE